MKPEPHLSMDPAQKREFLAGEGDQWFARNKASLATTSSVRDLIVGRIAAQLPVEGGSSVLEIGCGLGNNLASLATIIPIEAHGIEPSQEAVATGSKQYPELHLRTGTADELPYPDSSFDVVWFGFCMYLIDRALLQRAVAEADRVLRDGGVLVIVDFDPDQPTVRPYHHRAGLQSFKMDHSKLFLANPAYVLVEKHSTSHTTGAWTTDPQERVAITLCRKNLAQAYRPL
jgi:ubiquinone/menaquinone biosynthesis C-methylase UbiE